MRRFCFLGLFIMLSKSYAFHWIDLWSTKNQQAQKMMKDGQFKQAESTFEQPEWRATAAYRDGNYAKAAKQYQGLKNETGYYNEGNALAHLGQYAEAIKAYDKALSLNPGNKDASYNRKLLQDVLKKNKNQQDQKGKDQNKDKQNQNQDQNKDNPDQNQNDKQQNKDKQDKPNKDQNQDQKGQNQDNKNQKQDKPDQNRKGKNQNQNKQDKNKEDKNQNQDKDKKENQNKGKGASNSEMKQTPEEREKQQAKEQWLRLIPDDPGGLLRQKFLRDHLRREEGWNE